MPKVGIIFDSDEQIQNPLTAEALVTKSPLTKANAEVVDVNLAELWAKLLEAVGRASQFFHSQLVEAHPVAFNGKLLTIGFDPEFADHLALVDNSRNHAVLQTKLAELGHPDTEIVFVQGR